MQSCPQGQLREPQIAAGMPGTALEEGGGTAASGAVAGPLSHAFAQAMGRNRPRAEVTEGDVAKVSLQGGCGRG